MLFYCSVITPPSRFVNRVKVFAMDSFHAFRYIQDKYSRVINFCPTALVLVENDSESVYYNYIGVQLN